jgi:hypothetical protein
MTIGNCSHIESLTIDEGDPDQKVTELEKITIHFGYPLTHATDMEFVHPGGFSYRNFLQAVHDGYAKIYAAEKDPGRAHANSMNRGRSEGPYGIWGHDMGDLFLEGIEETAPGKFQILVGS